MLKCSFHVCYRVKKKRKKKQKYLYIHLLCGWNTFFRIGRRPEFPFRRLLPANCQRNYCTHCYPVICMHSFLTCVKSKLGGKKRKDCNIGIYGVINCTVFSFRYVQKCLHYKLQDYVINVINIFIE